MKQNHNEKMKQNHNEKGFTLVELLMSVVASGVLMLTVMNLMGLSITQWGKGNDIRELTTELSMTLDNLAMDVKASRFDSISVSPTNDTLNVGGSISFFVDGSDNFIMQRNGNTFELLEGMVSNFTVESPVVNTTGDTLDMVSVILVVQNENANDSTMVWLTPRL